MNLLFAFQLFVIAGWTQGQPLMYYLPKTSYDPAVPTPESVLGFQIGEWHVSHDQQLRYLEKLAASSPRVTFTPYARSYEERPLFYLTITSPANHSNLASIQQQHVALTDPNQSGELNTANMPLVIYQGFSIHGNEASGGNAALLVAYYLAAGQSDEVEKLLDNTVILLDPCFNPDGFQRFSTWVNMHKNEHLTDRSVDREYDEAWPGGRTNHYWFDLNRDWLLVQHPESQGRIRTFHEWKPNILTDHHEMGTNSTFFFMPGIPTRTNPLTPQENQDLTGRIGEFHAEALDEIGSLYYSQESFDDFYYGKGSTYPDANGSIGILFEQASSRGHLQESANGQLSFSFAVRNQVRTALSTQRAGLALRTDLLDYQRRFFRNAAAEAKSDPIKGYVFGDPHDRGRTLSLVELLRRHQIEVFALDKSIDVGDYIFEPGSSFVVPTGQAQYRLVKAAFETRTTFEDSIFYDVSTWTLPMAFNVPYQSLDSRSFGSRLLGDPVNGLRPEAVPAEVTRSAYAYLFRWDDYHAPTLLAHLLQKNVRAKVAHQPFTLEGETFDRGTIMVPVQNQSVEADRLYQLIQAGALGTGVKVVSVKTGYTSKGIDLGSPSFSTLRDPEVLLLVGDGVSSYDAGEVWHLLDQRYGVVTTMVEVDQLGRVDLSRYHTLVMVDGRYNSISNGTLDNLRTWVGSGGTLIVLEDAVRWCQEKGIGSVTIKNPGGAKNGETLRIPYARLRADRGSQVVGGAIFETELDLTHPLGYGYHRKRLPVFRRGMLLLEPAKNPYASPLVYTDTPLLSGYIKAGNLDALAGTASIVVSGLGGGRVIYMVDNPNFRAFWYGTNKLFANALFFGHTISRGSVARGE